MRSPQIKSLLKVLPKTQPVLLIGPPGVGKSEVVRQFARAEAKVEGREFIDFHKVASNIDKVKEIVSNPQRYYIYVDFRLTKCVPEDLLGLPEKIVIDGVTVYNYNPPIWAKLLSLPGISGLLFLDEITNVQRDDVISAAYAIVLDRKVGFTKLSNNVRIIAAGNPPEYSSIARPLPAPLTNRFLVVYVDAPTLDEWATYMYRKYGDNWNKLVYAYLQIFPLDFVKPPKEIETLENFPTPRSWTKLALATKREVIKEVCEGLVGREVGGKFYAFTRKRVPKPEELLENPKLFSSLDREAMAVACWSVAQYMTQMYREGKYDQIKDKVKKFVEYVSSVNREYVILLVKLIHPDIRLTLVKPFLDLIKDIIVKTAKY